MSAMAWTRLGLGRAVNMGIAHSLSKSLLVRSSSLPRAIAQSNHFLNYASFSSMPTKPETEAHKLPNNPNDIGLPHTPETTVFEFLLKHPLKKVEVDHELLRLIFPDGRLSLHITWFRDACACNQCVSQSSGQKKFATCDIDPDVKLESYQILEDGSLELVWAKDSLDGQSHTSHFTMPMLHELLGPAYPTPPERTLWDRAIFEKDMATRAINYDDWMAGSKPMAAALLNLEQWGLVVVKGVPNSQDAVKDIANKIGALESTFYGETWDVVSKPNAENVAYTDEYLCLHQDLLYMARPPRLQLLHCLQNDCEGGDSLFSDGARAAIEFKERHPADYATLARHPVNYKYNRNGNYYHASHTVFANKGRVKNRHTVRWAPPFRANAFAGQAVAQYYWLNPAKKFRDNIEAPENMLQFRLQPGDCVIFDNTRILHGRTKFNAASGQRHLRGCYLDHSAYQSALNRVYADGLVDGPRNKSTIPKKTTKVQLETRQKRLAGDDKPS